eukprot:scaffold29438_cov17-Tisochrysis_lutea.AAC.3
MEVARVIRPGSTIHAGRPFPYPNPEGTVVKRKQGPQSLANQSLLAIGTWLHCLECCRSEPKYKSGMGRIYETH